MPWHTLTVCILSNLYYKIYSKEQSEVCCIIFYAQCLPYVFYRQDHMPSLSRVHIKVPWGPNDLLFWSSQIIFSKASTMIQAEIEQESTYEKHPV